MPDPGTVNNPSGANSFDHFAPEPAYGEGTRDAALAASAPLAGGRVAAGAIGAPKRAQRRATKPQAPSAVQTQPLPPEIQQPTPAMTVAATWAAVAAAPGAENYPVLQQLADAAQ